MAFDEACFLWTQKNEIALLRVYCWSQSAVTIGYFDKLPDNETRPVIRRITGGGLVEHGNDVTFCLTLPPKSSAAIANSEERYLWIHQSLRRALTEKGHQLTFESESAKPVGPCFSNPVKWDLLDESGHKIVGGAQRRSKGSVIHQGSIDLAKEQMVRIEQFAALLGHEVSNIPESTWSDLENLANPLNSNKYATSDWREFRKFNR